jgi:pimeloyl-ACP methyl ester carboxylesterase
VTVGEEDILVPPQFSRELAARIPGADLKILAGVGHVYFWEQPDVFNGLCLDFLSKVG